MTLARKKPKGEEVLPEPVQKSATEAIREIETLQGGRVLVYTSGRSIAFWDIAPLYRLLAKMGHQSKLSIIIQSRGGFPDDAFKMANVIREFADHVTFIVASYANSAATMLCLSGDEILMGPISELGPTNPMMYVDERLITPTVVEPSTVRGEPKEKQRPQQRQMAAHALRDFLTAAGVLRMDENGAFGYDPEVLSVYMANGILNPFILGEFERSGKISVQYCETLLKRYMFRDRDDADGLAPEVARRLCEGYYDHNYSIGRKEAREVLKLKVQDMSDELCQRTSELLSAYDEMIAAQNIATIIETSDGFEIDHWPSAP